LFEKIIAAQADDLLSALVQVAEQEKGKAKKSLTDFHDLLATLRQTATKKPLAEFLASVVMFVGYEEYLGRLRGDAYENTEERIENVRELRTVAKKFNDRGADGLSAFLEEVALLQDTDKLTLGERAVTLMTMHASKGLEFPVVFLAGMEEGLFPHSRTLWAPHELEEERRLCYVAVTRAKERLYMSYAKWRTIFGARQASLPSRFIGEMPQDIIATERSENASWRDRDNEADDIIDY
jgi:DNA helicase-2/ATP-dependent DNA helicase PcrA